MRTAITIASLCTSMPIYLMSRLIQLPPWGKDHSSSNGVFPSRDSAFLQLICLYLSALPRLLLHHPSYILARPQRSEGRAASGFNLLKQGALSECIIGSMSEIACFRHFGVGIRPTSSLRGEKPDDLAHHAVCLVRLEEKLCVGGAIQHD